MPSRTIRAARLTLALLAAPLPASAQSTPLFQPDLHRTASGCLAWLASIIPLPPGLPATWSGACPDGQADGPGRAVATFPDGEIAVEATFRAGRPIGPTRIFEKTRLLFEGGFTEHGAEGPGTLTTDTGATTTFDFRASVPVATLAIRLPDGSVREGRFDVGNRSGTGTGIERLPNGTSYEGPFVDGKYEGRGTLTYATGSRYDGEFHLSLRHGHGTLVAPNGNHVEGDWRDGQLEGRAQTRAADGTVIIDADWHNGKRNGQGFSILADKSRYTGAWKDSLPEGEGELLRADGTRIAGTWHHGCLKSAERWIAVLVDPSTCQ